MCRTTGQACPGSIDTFKPNVCPRPARSAGFLRHSIRLENENDKLRHNYDNYNNDCFVRLLLLLLLLL